ncbi:MAG: protein kinase [Armatimonadetes bacterium]|nr:protein kinase [Armatimonadota bacterium]
MARKSDEFRYEAVDREGEGTLFVVYKARDRVLNKPVALKVLRQRYMKDPLFAENLRKALQTTVDLPHPGIARVYSTGEEDGHLYIAAEYVRGETLAERLRRESPLSRKDALSLLIQISEAVYHAHQNGIVHGDLRPKNILCGADGKVKVTDFAVANAFFNAYMLLPDVIPDAARYMSSETAQGGAATAYSDQYSLGVIAYQMVTGSVPFDGKSVKVILDQQVSRKPSPPSNFNPSVSPVVEDAIMKLLAKDPHDRYASFGELLKDLRQIEQGGEPGREVNDWGSAALQRPKRTNAREQIAQPVSREPERSGLSGAAWSLAIILASILLIVGVGYFYVATTPKEVAVPDLAGKSIAEAEALLESANLFFTEARKEYDPKVAEGCVIATMPPAGRKVKEGRTISARVSLGQELVQVPDLREIPLEKAKGTLKEAGLALGDVQEVYSPLVPKGLILSQLPAPMEKVGKSTNVSVQRSRGPEPVIPEDSSAGGEPPKERSIHVAVAVPQGSPRQEVKVVIHDTNGYRTVYQQMHSPGDKIDEQVSVVGDVALVRVYVAGALVSEKEL